MLKFRKKPVVIEAVQFDGNIRSLDVIPFSIAGAWLAGKDEKGPYVKIPTLEGEMRADAGDWIIRGINGEYYPCKPDIFEKTYDKVEE